MEVYYIIIMSFPYIPKELVNIILEYDGRIKYRKGEYVNIIHKKDSRYETLKPILLKKLEIIRCVQIDLLGFYFDFSFDLDNRVGLCYDYNWSYRNKFEICYFDLRNDDWKQIRTFL